MELFNILQRPVMTEKSTISQEMQNKYTLQVSSKATKRQIKRAVELAFKVKVVKVNTLNTKSKQKRLGRFVGKSTPWKKAIVTLAEGNNIEFIANY
jgi:large subunit ribosomal protein L23